MPNNFPKLHNAMWPGIVGKGAPDSEPIIPLDTLLELTAGAEADGQRFDGVDLFVVAPHFDIDSDLDAVKRMSGADFKVELAGRRLGDPAWVVAASDRARAVLKWQPHFDDLESIVCHALAWERKLLTRAS